MLYTDVPKISVTGHRTDRKIDQITRRVRRFVAYTNQPLSNNELINYDDDKNIRTLCFQYIDYINACYLHLRASSTTEPTVHDFGGGIGIGQMVFEAFYPEKKPFNFYTLTRSHMVDGELYSKYSRWLRYFDINDYFYGGDINDPDIHPITAYTVPPHKADCFIMNRVPETALNAHNAVLDSALANPNAIVWKRLTGSRVKMFTYDMVQDRITNSRGNSTFLDQTAADLRRQNDKLFGEGSV